MSEPAREMQQRLAEQGATGEWPIMLRLPAGLHLDDDQLLALCSANDTLRIERSAQGDLEIMPPTGGETGNRNAELTTQLRLWAKGDGSGVAFDSSTGFRLPNGALRSPDAAWVGRSRLAGLTREQKQRFLPLCPDLAVELASPSDSLPRLQAKMEEYRASGARLGWLLETAERRVHVYRPERPAQVLHAPEHLYGDPELPGLTLDLAPIWEPDL